ncbi:Eisosome component PIL1/LSP1 [Chaetomium tenue]|uniref:Eisosome component PIL1/LSP1 n=1 Tax=Chaetomium tenue TaxID=1854479 RepID=A0ACB7PPP0_9PEZI|nr:Eisosome component PIL1/LSP1 [Chaetomium globosum]
MLNRALSIRSSNRSSTTTTSTTTSSGTTTASSHRKPFSFHSLRGASQPALSKRLYRLIKSANTLVSAHETAARERLSIATQLSEWGEQTPAAYTITGGGGGGSGSGVGGGGGNDAAVSDVSDKIGVLLSELGEQEEVYAARLDESRAVLKVVRNTEKSVQPSRDGKRKVAEEIQRLKIKEPQSARLVTLEQELVRAEAENLVAEAQLGNVTRQKLKEAYTVDFLATIERSEKQAILARHGLRLLQLLDDTPVVPGDVRPPYAHASQTRQILNDAEDDLREWRLDAGFMGDDKTVVMDGSEPSTQRAEETGKQKEKPKQKEAEKGHVPDTSGDGLGDKY